MDNNTVTAQKKRKSSSAILMMISSIAFCLLVAVRPFVFLYSYDTLDRVLLVIEYMAAICVVCCFVRSLISIKSQRAQSGSRHAALKIFVFILILACDLFLWDLLELQANGLQTAGHFSVDKKYSQDGKHYISIHNEDVSADIAVDAETYEALIIDEDVSYPIEYRTIRLSSTGVLEKSIDTGHFIDNRN